MHTDIVTVHYLAVSAGFILGLSLSSTHFCCIILLLFVLSVINYAKEIITPEGRSACPCVVRKKIVGETC